MEESLYVPEEGALARKPQNPSLAHVFTFAVFKGYFSEGCLRSFSVT